jgi:SAM-dependent methyltransferase
MGYDEFTYELSGMERGALPSSELSTADRIISLFDALGLQRAHVLACASADWGDLITHHPQRLQSIAVVAPHLNQGIPAAARDLASPSLVVAGDQGVPAERARTLADSLSGSSLELLPGYESPMWADTVADCTDDLERCLLAFWEGIGQSSNAPMMPITEGSGDVSGIRYRIEGKGQPIVLLPLSLAPSQWEPLVARIKHKYSVITLGGAHLGAVALLEGRAISGYGELISELLELTRIAEGESILEVGCGSGALARELARKTCYRNKVTASDLNPYLLSEARQLAVGSMAETVVSFEQANAEELPFDDAVFDVSISSTVMEEGNADRMIAELARVTRPGGRALTVVRATDVDWWVNLPVSQELLKRINALGPKTGAGVGQGGCADSSLYSRLISVNLKPLNLGPRFAFYRSGDRLRDVLGRLGGALPEDARSEFEAAVELARSRGTLCVGEPFHCAISIAE